MVIALQSATLPRHAQASGLYPDSDQRNKAVSKIEAALNETNGILSVSSPVGDAAIAIIIKTIPGTDHAEVLNTLDKNIDGFSYKERESGGTYGKYDVLVINDKSIIS